MDKDSRGFFGIGGKSSNENIELGEFLESRRQGGGEVDPDLQSFLKSRHPGIPGDSGESSMARRVIGDTAVGLAKGTLVGLPEAVVGLADLVTGGYAGKGVETAAKGIGIPTFKEAGQKFTDLLTPETQEAQRKVSEAEGFVDTLTTAIKNPSSIAQTVAESLPSMFGGAFAGRMAMKAIGHAPKFGKALSDAVAAAGGPQSIAGKALLRANTTKAITAGAVGEGLISAGQNTEELRTQMADGLITPQQALIMASSGAVTGLISRMSGGLARRLGFPDVDTLLQGVNTGAGLSGTKAVLKGVILSAITEGAFEELPQSAQEQYAANLAAGKEDLWEGVAEAGAMGLLAGAAMGMMGAGGATIRKHIQDSDPTNQKIDTMMRETGEEEFNAVTVPAIMTGAEPVRAPLPGVPPVAAPIVDESRSNTESMEEGAIQQAAAEEIANVQAPGIPPADAPVDTAITAPPVAPEVQPLASIPLEPQAPPEAVQEAPAEQIPAAPVMPTTPAIEEAIAVAQAAQEAPIAPAPVATPQPAVTGATPATPVAKKTDLHEGIPPVFVGMSPENLASFLAANPTNVWAKKEAEARAIEAKAGVAAAAPATAPIATAAQAKAVIAAKKKAPKATATPADLPSAETVTGPPTAAPATKAPRGKGALAAQAKIAEKKTEAPATPQPVAKKGKAKTPVATAVPPAEAPASAQKEYTYKSPLRPLWVGFGKAIGQEYTGVDKNTFSTKTPLSKETLAKLELEEVSPATAAAPVSTPKVATAAQAKTKISEAKAPKVVPKAAPQAEPKASPKVQELTERVAKTASEMAEREKIIKALEAQGKPTRTHQKPQDIQRKVLNRLKKELEAAKVKDAKKPSIESVQQNEETAELQDSIKLLQKQLHAARKDYDEAVRSSRPQREREILAQTRDDVKSDLDAAMKELNALLSQPKLSRREAPVTGTQPEKAQAAVDAALSYLKNPPVVQVIPDINTFINSDDPVGKALKAYMEEKGMLDEAGQDNRTVGFFWNGTIYIVAANHGNAQDVIKTLTHELTHNGLGAFFDRQKGTTGLGGTKLKYDILMDRIFKAHAEAVTDITLTTHQHLDISTTDGQRKAAEEWLCNQTYEAQPKWYDSLVAIFNELLRKIGIDIKISDAEVRVILQSAFKEFGYREGEPQFSRNMGFDNRNYGSKILSGELKPPIDVESRLSDVAAFLESVSARDGRIDHRTAKRWQNDQIVGAIKEMLHVSIRKYPDALGWYKKDLDTTMSILQDVYPELKKPANKFRMIMAIAISSNGNDTTTNIELGANIYESWKETSNMQSKVVAARGTAIAKALQMADRLAGTFKNDAAFEKWLLGESYVGDLYTDVATRLGITRDSAKQLIGASEGAGAMLPRSIVFGPKVGAFFANLSGNFTPVTMDRWFMRTMGRLTGKLVASGKAKDIAAQREAMAAAIDGSPEGMRMAGVQAELFKSKRNIDNVAAHIAKLCRNEGFRNDLNAVKGGPALRLAANTRTKYRNGSIPIDSPQSGAQRQWLRDRINEARESLATEGIKYENADIQAAIWIGEKELYKTFGVSTRTGDYYSVGAETLYERIHGKPSGRIAGVTGRVVGRGKPRVGESLPLFSRKPNSIIEKIRDIALNSPDGFTINVSDGTSQKTGYAVAPSKQTETRVSEVTEENLADFIDKYSSVFKKDTRAFLGGWFDSQAKEFVLDVSFVVDSLEDALYIADIGDQIAIFHLDNFEEIGREDGIQKLKSAGIYSESRRDGLRGIQESLHSAIQGRRDNQAQGPAFSRRAGRTGPESQLANRRGTGEVQGQAPIESGVHYSKAPRKSLDSKFYGTGLADAASKRLPSDPKSPLRHRIHFYYDTGEGLPKAEVGVGTYAHNADLSQYKIYDLSAGTIKINQVMGEDWRNTLELAIMESGFDGFANPDYGVAVLLGKRTVAVTPEEPQFARAPKVDSPEFKKWFGNSKVVDKDGNPLVVYHGTRTSPSKFKKIMGMFGHFGTIAAANDKLEWDAHRPGQHAVMPVYLSLQNPARMEDVHFDEYGTMAEDLIESGVLSKKDLPLAWGERYSNLDTKYITRLINVLKSKGYDGIVYENRIESPGEDSWIPFAATQIKSATGNIGTFDANNPDIRFSRTEEKKIEEWKKAAEEHGVRYEGVQRGKGGEVLSPLFTGDFNGVRSTFALEAGETIPQALKRKEAQQKRIDEEYEKRAKEPLEIKFQRATPITETEGPVFFSQMIKAVEPRLPKSTTGKQLYQNFKEWADGGMFKKDEYEWSGLGEWLKERSGRVVTRQEVMDYLNANQMEIRELVNDDGQKRFPEGWTVVPSTRKTVGAPEWNVSDDSGKLQNRITAYSYEAAVEKATNIHGIEGRPTRYKSYLLPGGQNYREILFRLDTERGKLKQANEGEGTLYTGPHFEDTNVFAHTRLTDHVSKQGDSVLLVEEAQSDWHQAGRSRGYAGEVLTDERVKKIFDLPDNASPKELYEAREEYDTPWHQLDLPMPAPFSKTWQELIMKRMLRYAVERGYDKLAWTTGEQQAKRYRLSNHIKELQVYKKVNGKYEISFVNKDGMIRDDNNEYTAGKLVDVIGKELAQKAVSDLSGVSHEIEKEKMLLEDKRNNAFENAKKKASADGLNASGEMFPGMMAYTRHDWLLSDPETAQYEKYINAERLPDADIARLRELRGLTRNQRLGNVKYSGLDLKVGGKGMEGFYDKMLPDFMSKYIKKWGGKVEDVEIYASKDPFPWKVVKKEYAGRGAYSTTVLATFPTKAEAEAFAATMNDPKEPEYTVEGEGTRTVVHSVAITEPMKESVMQGQPMFARAPKAAKPTAPQTAPPAVPPGNGATWNAPVPSAMDTMWYRMVDKHVDLREITKAIENFAGTIKDTVNASLKETLFSGRVAKRVENFLETELRPVLKALAGKNIDISDFEEYLHYRHAEEANDYVKTLTDENGNVIGMQDGGSGKTYAQIKAYFAGLTPSVEAKMAPIAAMVDALTKENTRLMVEYNLESQDTVDKWLSKYQHYVPLFRQHVVEARIGTGSGLTVTGSVSRKRKGSQKAVVNVLANIANQRERVIASGEKNIIATALYGLTKQHPNNDFWKVVKPGIKKVLNLADNTMIWTPDADYKKKKNVVMSRQREADGSIVERGVEFNLENDRARRMADAIRNIDMDTLGLVLGTSAKVTRFIASMNTQYNPIFGVTNFVRDVGTAMLNLTTTPIAGKQAETMKHAIPALMGIYSSIRKARGGQVASSQWSKLFDEFQMHGGQTGYRDLYETTDERSRRLEREINQMQGGRPLKAGMALFGWLSDYNTAMENAIRLSAYKVGIDSGMSKDAAAAMAKSLTVNFNRKGQIATQAGSLYAFFNATAQGISKVYETLTGPAGKRVIAGGLLFGVIQASVLAAAGMGDDEPPEFVQEKNIIIPLPGTEGKYITIPMPLGFNVLPNIGRMSAQFAMGGFQRPFDKMAALFGVILDGFNPLGASKTLMQTISPTPIDPLMALAENKDWTGKPIYREDFSSLHPTPGYTRAKDTATWGGRGISWGLNMLTGGTRATPGFFSPTPDQIDYLFGQATGGVGREFAKTQQTTAMLLKGEDVPAYKIPLGSRFYGATKGDAYEGTRYYENLKLMNRHEDEIKDLMMHRESPSEYIASNPEARLWRVANKSESAINKLTKKRTEMKARGASESALRAIDALILSHRKKFNEMVEGAKG